MKGTTEKVIYQKGGLLGTLLRFGLPLMKNVLTPLAKDFFSAIRGNSSTVSNKCGYSKEHLWIMNDYNDNFKQRNGRYCENS